MKEERIFKASSGYLVLVLALVAIAATIFAFIGEIFWLGSVELVTSLLARLNVSTRMNQW